MEGMYDWPYYIPFEAHDNYPAINPVPSRRPMPPSPFMDAGYHTNSPFHTNNPPVPSRRPMPPPPFMDAGYHTNNPPVPSRRRLSTPSKQVVSIPVNFVGCRPTRSDYAVKIQKAFRGYRIRKNVRKILELKRGVDEVERDLMEGESVELIIRDDRHRLKVSETLMALLLKLDSIRGLNDAVRVCRKAVIRKAILLQERIDSLAAAAAVVEEDDPAVNVDSSRMQVEETAEEDKSESKLSEIDENAFSEMQIEKDNESEAAWECVDEQGKVENVELEEEDTKQGWLVVEEEDKNKVMLEKMAEDNRRLMEMVTELCKNKDNQTRLIQTLSRRVDQLEQAINDRIIIRKKDNKKINKPQTLYLS